MKSLFKLVLCLLITGCMSFIKSGVPKENYKIPAYGQPSYEIDTGKNVILLGKDIGMCGGKLMFIFGIPIPLFANNCESEGFQLYTSANEIFLRYNEVLYKPRFNKYYINYQYDPKTKQNIYFDKPKEIISYDRPIFKIANFEEFKKAKDKAIIVKENGITIKEIPFEWGLIFILQSAN